MKRYLPYIIVFLIGAILGGICNYCVYHDRDVEIQRDTIVRYEKVPYSKVDLSKNTMKLELPSIGSPELVYIETHALDTIYRNNEEYVTLPRQFFFTKTDDAEIWHSGIDSRIDSLNVFRKTTNVTETINRANHKNAISIGVEARYHTSLSVPIYFQYESNITPWFSLYGQIGYEVHSRVWGVSVGTRFRIQW